MKPSTRKMLLAQPLALILLIRYFSGILHGINLPFFSNSFM